MGNELEDLNINIIETPYYTEDIRKIIEMSRNVAYQAVNIVLLKRNWLIGKRIYNEELNGNNRAEYGRQIIMELSRSLTFDYGRGFGKTNLYQFYTFYKTYPNIFQSVIGKSFDLLSWTHYSILISVFDSDARIWYEKECKSQNWSVRNL